VYFLDFKTLLIFSKMSCLFTKTAFWGKISQKQHFGGNTIFYQYLAYILIKKAKFKKIKNISREEMS
jgi:hypothetical protein